MKIKIFLSACAAVLLLMPALHASASHETAGQAAAKASAPHHADTRQLGEGARTLPDDALPLPVATPHTLPASKDLPATTLAKGSPHPATAVAPTRAGDADAQPGRRYRQQDDAPLRGSGFGIAALTLGLLAITVGWLFSPVGLLFAVLAIVFGCVGLGRNRKGRGMAIAGLVLGLLVLVLTALFIAFLIALFA